MTKKRRIHISVDEDVYIYLEKESRKQERKLVDLAAVILMRTIRNQMDESE